MTHHASGSFDVTMLPQAEDKADGANLGRMSLDKQFQGDLDGRSAGTMLTAVMDSGAAVYVAIERVTGMLHGRSGSFVLLHNGRMTRDAQQLTITVVPDSGTEQLAGLAGDMTITNDDGHTYDFTYTLD